MKNEDFITRYGGDEFILFLNVNSSREVESIMSNVSDSLASYNKSSNAPYKLSFSYGYELYNFDKPMDANEYISHVDKLMYKHKNRKKFKNSVSN